MTFKIDIFGGPDTITSYSVKDFRLHYNEIIKTNCYEFLITVSFTPNNKGVYTCYSASDCMHFINAFTVYDLTVSKLSKSIADTLNNLF